jgi:hypothetical protein
MGKVIFEFDSIEEANEIRTALDGSRWHSVVWELDQYLRNKVKHCPDGEDSETYQAVRDKLRDTLEEYNLNLD